MSETIFSKIIRKEIPANIVYEDDRCMVFHDIAPVAPVHVLVIPKQPIRSVAAIAPGDAPLIGHLFEVIRNVADQLGLDGGYRVVTNCGDDAGQEVQHLHFHVIGGKKLSWPPGVQ